MVAIGGSAGSLEALKSFFSAIPDNSELAYVILVHAKPDQPTMLADLLAKKSRIPVALAEDGDRITAGRAYVTPAGFFPSLDNDKLLFEKPAGDPIPMPIDMMFRSFAGMLGERLAAVVLSGSNADGSQGVKAVKEANGLVMVQDEESAEHTIMPRHAVDTRAADFVLAPAEMPEKLHSFFDGFKTLNDADFKDGDRKVMNTICSVLESRIGHDFSNYKQSSMMRRITRRMTVNRISDSKEYIQYLRNTPEECNKLFEELLIGVTQFFRDPEAYEKLKEVLLRDLLPDCKTGRTFRVWVPGCSTGEEVYSLAIIIHECLDQLDLSLDVHIFGTDIDERAINVARKGVYPASIQADIDKGRLSRYFSKENSDYIVNARIRDNIVFSIQNILHDPPFSRLHLLCCRNLLIYLNAKIQQKLLPLFHHSLVSGGLLMLGPSESIGRYSDLFATKVKHWKIFQRREVATEKKYPLTFPPRKTDTKKAVKPEAQSPPNDRFDLGEVTRQAVLDHFSPPAVLIDTNYEICHIQGRPGKYIEHPSGAPTNKLIDLAREGLRIELSMAIREAISTQKKVVRNQISVKTNGDNQMIDLHVLPTPTDKLQDYLLVSFVDVESKDVDFQSSSDNGNDKEKRISELENELLRQRANHQATIEELDTANEELKSTNEELQSTNEEWQSSNEELESTKEELQSLNEELQTVNNELQSKVDELVDSNDDMRNLLNSTRIATVFVDNEHCVRRFTEEAGAIINLIRTDINRPLYHVATNLVDENLDEHLSRATKQLVTVTKEVRTDSGDWYNMRIVPYRTNDNRIDGAVITFTDINAQKKVQQEFREAKENAETAWQLIRHVFDMTEKPTAVLDRHGRIVVANRNFADLLDTPLESIVGIDFLKLHVDAFEKIDLATKLTKALEKNRDFSTDTFRMDNTDGRQNWSIHGRIIKEGEEFPYRIILTMELEE